MNTDSKGSKQLDINQILAYITSELVGHFNVESVLDRVVETSMQTLHAEVCSIFLEDKQNEPGILTMRTGSGFAKNLIGEAKYKIGEGFTGTIAKYGRKYNIKSKEELESLTYDGERVWRGKFDHKQWPTGQSQFRNCIALPLRIKEQIFGVIKVENKDLNFGEYFSEEDEKYFETMANVVALAIENARLHEQIERQLKTIASKTAHRIHNQVTNYDGIEVELFEQVESIGIDRDKLKELAKRIAETTKSIKRMVDEFDGYGKPLEIKKEICDINEIIEKEVEIAKYPKKEIKIVTSFDKIPHIALDAGRFAEAIKELIRNSVKSVSKNLPHKKYGYIEVSTTLHLDSIIEPNKAYKLLIDVKDNGPGFPPNFPIFEPFKSTDPQSTGLGLATVKELVEAHGGQIEPIPSEEGGAHLRIIIPFSQYNT